MDLPNSLTTLANARAWLSLPATNTNSDAILNRLIPAVSQQVYEYLQRDNFASRQCVDVFDGPGGLHAFLKEWPVTSISSVVINNQPIPAAAPDNGLGTSAGASWGYGWKFELWSGTPPGNPCAVEARGFRWWKGQQNCVVTYDAGYLTAEIWSPDPSSYRVTLNQSKGPWIFDNGVVYASTGTPLVLVTTTPTAGQYQLLPADNNGTGYYQFAAADVGQQLTISYSFVPYSVEQVVLDMINERYSYRSRVGVKSRSLAGQETSTYDMSGIPPYAVRALQPYRNVLPL